ncbi:MULTISPECIES: hypothetical protein [unclassified Enterococcus]|uniref:hypothetical protein n=1 Tax=unclassified Enterococcus TaxID=2608891 RepID=UPI000A35AF20|nr:MULTISPECIES: hypothetical protein [unclassified Enterococcus]
MLSISSRNRIELTKSELQVVVQYHDKSIPKGALYNAFNSLKAVLCGGLFVATRKALNRMIIVVNQHVKKAYKNSTRTFLKKQLY